MSASNSQEVKTKLTGDETHSLGSHEVEDFGNVATSSSAPITSEEVPRQIKAASDPLTKQLERLCDLMRELRRDTCRLSEETSGLFQGPSRPRCDRFDKMIGSLSCNSLLNCTRFLTPNCRCCLDTADINAKMCKERERQIQKKTLPPKICITAKTNKFNNSPSRRK